MNGLGFHQEVIKSILQIVSGILYLGEIKINES